MYVCNIGTGACMYVFETTVTTIVLQISNENGTYGIYSGGMDDISSNITVSAATLTLEFTSDMSMTGIGFHLDYFVVNQTGPEDGKPFTII